jgi:ABC-type transport system involved in multi-copper enzyme maturation permease subunit
VFGAIFLQEMLIAGRRQRGYFLRWLYAAVLLFQLLPRIIASIFYEMQRPGSSALSLYVRFFDSFTDQHFLYLLVLTPALTAGAVTDDKLRGTLDHLLTTCLHPAEIVLGKLLARVCQLLVFTLVALPIVCFFGVIVDLDVPFALMLFAASAVLIAATGSLSLLTSVWCQRTRDAVLCTYLALFAVFLLAGAAASAGWQWPADVLSPWHTIDRTEDGRPAPTRLLPFASAWLAPAVVCVGVACWRLRPAYASMRQSVRGGWMWRRLRPIRAAENPVAWRERALHGIAPFAAMRLVPLWLAVPTFAILSAVSLVGLVVLRLSDRVDILAAFEREGLAGLHVALRLGGVEGWAVAGPHAGTVVFVLTLLLAVRASGGITDERERGNWDALLLTPLSTPEIVRGKFWGLIRATRPYVIAYAIVMLPLALLIGAEALVVAVAGIGAMVVAAPFIIAVGLYWSARLSSGWRSVLATLASWYGYLVVASMLLMPACILGCIVKGLMSLFAPVFQDVLPDADALAGGLATALSMLLINALIIGPFAWVLLQWAETRIDRTERAHVSRLEHDKQELLTRLNRLADELAEEERH